MNNNLYFLYNIIQKICIFSNKNSVSKNNILEYVEPFIFYKKSNISRKQYLTNIINDLNEYTTKKYFILYNDEYQINLLNNEYNIYENCKKSIIELNNEIEGIYEDGFYECDSFTNNNIYFLDKDLLKCTCKSYQYCNLEIKTCKHLNLAKENMVVDSINTGINSINIGKFY